MPDNVAAIVFVPPPGLHRLALPPGQYEVVVTRGPDGARGPLPGRTRGQAVDLSTNNQAVTATHRPRGRHHRLDERGSARALGELRGRVAEERGARDQLRRRGRGRALLPTDHDFITDFAPFVRSAQSRT